MKILPAAADANLLVMSVAMMPSLVIMGGGGSWSGRRLGLVIDNPKNSEFYCMISVKYWVRVGGQ